MDISITIDNGKSIPFPAPFRFLYFETVEASSVPVEIIGTFEGKPFIAKSGKEIILADTVEQGFRLINNTGSAVTVVGSYGMDRQINRSLSGGSTISAQITNTPNVNVANDVEIAENDGLSVAGDTTIGTTAKVDFAAPATAKGAVVTLVTPGFTFGEIRVSGSNAYAADTGIPLPVDGSPIYIDAAADLSIHNKHATNTANVNVTWISKS
jgi:hypothetical protein